jgi:hypothetical protein
LDDFENLALINSTKIGTTEINIMASTTISKLFLTNSFWPNAYPNMVIEGIHNKAPTTLYVKNFLYVINGNPVGEVLI